MTCIMRSQQQVRFLQRYGPWAVVTGASSGIGRAICVQLAQRGSNVVAVARSEERLGKLQDELQTAYGVDVLPVSTDLARPDSLEVIASATAGLDVGLLAAAAGFGTSGSFLRADAKSEREMLAVNCKAVLEQCLHFGRRFASRERGGIVLMASLVGFQGVPRSASYAATKAYVQTLAEGLHGELAPLGVDVLASAPGPVRSGFEARANMRMSTSLDPDDVARETLAALGRKTVVLPGLLSKVLAYSLAPLSRPMRSRIMGSIMMNMTRHQDAAPE